MGNSSSLMIEITVAISLFVGALTMYAILFVNVAQVVESTNKVTGSQDRNVHTTLVIPEDYLVSGAEVLQSINHIGQIGVDIQVDSKVFSRSLDIDYTDVSMIDVFGLYKPVHERDANGQLLKVVYIPH
jgi:uncharacterized protein YycO